jgi:hypothetical protein
MRMSSEDAERNSDSCEQCREDRVRLYCAPGGSDFLFVWHSDTDHTQTGPVCAAALPMLRTTVEIARQAQICTAAWLLLCHLWQGTALRLPWHWAEGQKRRLSAKLRHHAHLALFETHLPCLKTCARAVGLDNFHSHDSSVQMCK